MDGSWYGGHKFLIVLIAMEHGMVDTSSSLWLMYACGICTQLKAAVMYGGPNEGAMIEYWSQNAFTHTLCQQDLKEESRRSMWRRR